MSNDLDYADYMDDLQWTAADRGQAALDRGDLVGGMLGYGGAVLLGRAGVWLRHAFGGDPLQQPADGERARRQRRRRPPHQTVTAVDPFAVLGLDPALATEKDVREMQRRLAAIWHADRGGSPQAQENLKAVNRAADECIRTLRGESGTTETD